MRTGVVRACVPQRYDQESRRFVFALLLVYIQNHNKRPSHFRVQHMRVASYTHQSLQVRVLLTHLLSPVSNDSAWGNLTCLRRVLELVSMVQRQKSTVPMPPLFPHNEV